MRHVVVDRDRFIKIAIGHQIKQRPERFVLHDFKIGFCGRQAWLHVTFAGNAQPFAAVKDLATLIFQSLDGMLDKIDSALIDERAHHGIFIERIPDRQTLISSQKFMANFGSN